MPMLPTTRAALVAGALAALLPSLAQAQKKRERDVVRRDEIAESGQAEGDLYGVLRNLRPRFLEPPTMVKSLGNARTVPTLVVVDGKRMGGLDVLQSITASTVDEVRYLEPSKSGTEYGQTGSGGAVVVKLWRAPKVSKSVPADTMQPPIR